ncbi:MAG: hypothetical protein JW807_02475 [Spirochaetes bacterium]|nr:hypothetical protein [Spirochaetota bacterium]
MKKRAGSDIGHLKTAMDEAGSIFAGVSPERFASPYTVVPLLSQVLGLNAPLLGTGGSPYSLFNYMIELAPKKELFARAFDIPFAQKRLIVDEVYDAIAPCLLGEEEEYIDLLAETRHSRGDRPLLKEKMVILKDFILRYHNDDKRGDFAHLAHYGLRDDLNRECWFIGKMPEKKRERWFRHSYPVVNELVIRIDGRPLLGWIIFIANSTEQLLRDGKLRHKKIMQAASLADRLGARRAAMAGLVASFAEGGKHLSERLPDIGFTTGHAYTIGNILQIAGIACSRTGLDLGSARIAVVGAAGSIGSGCAKLLAARGARRLLLVEMLSFASQKKLEGLKEELLKINDRLDIALSVKMEAIAHADLIIVATNSPTSVVPARLLKKGAIVIDDSFPKNVSRTVMSRRRDIVLVEGGAVSVPVSTDIDSARNMPDLMDAPLTRLLSCKETYGCFAEILTLAMTDHTGNYGLGTAEPALAGDIMERAEKIGFRPAPLQCFGQVVPEERFETARKIIKERE